MGEERRQFPRITQPLEAQYRPSGEFSELWRTVQTLDLSAVGIRVRSEVPLEFWTTLDIRLRVPGLREPLMLRGRVAWNTTLPSGMAEIGVAFVDLGPEQQVQIDTLVQFLKDRK